MKKNNNNLAVAPFAVPGSVSCCGFLEDAPPSEPHTPTVSESLLATEASVQTQPLASNLMVEYLFI